MQIVRMKVVPWSKFMPGVVLSFQLNFPIATANFLMLNNCNYGIISPHNCNCERNCIPHQANNCKCNCKWWVSARHNCKCNCDLWVSAGHNCTHNCKWWVIARHNCKHNCNFSPFQPYTYGLTVTVWSTIEKWSMTIAIHWTQLSVQTDAVALWDLGDNHMYLYAAPQSFWIPFSLSTPFNNFDSFFIFSIYYLRIAF